MSDPRMSAPPPKSNGALIFIVGGLVVAVGVVAYVLTGGSVPDAGAGSGSGDANITIENNAPAPAAPAAPAPAEPAPAEPAPAEPAPAPAEPAPANP